MDCQVAKDDPHRFRCVDTAPPDHLTETGFAQISSAHLGRVLAQAGLSFQRTRTWKAGPDPEREPKAARILDLKAAPPLDGGHVIAFDQMGPISLRPTAGAGWAPLGRPERLATEHGRVPHRPPAPRRASTS